MQSKRSTLGTIKGKMFGRKPSNTELPVRTYEPTRRPPPSSDTTGRDSDDEPPPAYNAPSSTGPMNTGVSPSSINTFAPTTTVQNNAQPVSEVDDRYEFLRTFDTVFLIDDSGSMAGSNWREVSHALEAIAPICTKYDKDGIDIKFLNTREQACHSNITEASTVHEIFTTVRPSGGTPTGQRLNAILKEHLRQLESRRTQMPKPVNIIIITDGEPSDDVESPIIRAAKQLDKLDAEPWQIGIQFFQVGGDLYAKQHLETLDDALSSMGGGCRDIVDTVPFLPGRSLDADMILKVVLGAVNRRLDRRQNLAR